MLRIWLRLSEAKPRWALCGFEKSGLSAVATSSLYAGAAKKADALALLGGAPVRSEPFSSTWAIFDENEEKALLKALRSRNWCCLMDNTPPTDKEMLSMDSKIMFLAARKDMDGILEAFEKVAKNTDKLI